MTRIEPCKRCGRRLVIRAKGWCDSCWIYHKGKVTPSLWKRTGVRPRTVLAPSA